ncbi:MAG: hypothetical protein ABEJ06_04260 [Haloarculaceae archaeon]
MSDDHEHEESEPVEDIYIERQTAPQQPYTMRDVGIGFVVAIVGLAIVFGLPFVMG